MGNCGLVTDQVMMNGSTGAAGLWPTANRAYYTAVMVEREVTVTQMGFEVGTSAGNYDIGIYNYFGTRLVNKGSTAVPASGIAVADITDTLLTPGNYFWALQLSDATTATILRTNVGSNAGMEVCGIQRQDVGSIGLPTTATFTICDNAYFPCIHAFIQATV